MSEYILKGRLITAASDEVIAHGTVIVKDDRIVFAGPSETAPECSGAVLDAGEGTILPGFIDVHAHLTGEEDAGDYADGKMFGDQIVGAVYQAGLLLDAGFTSLRDMSEAGIYVSRGVERGIIRGPKIMPGGKVLSITSGHVDMAPQMTPEQFNQSDQCGNSSAWVRNSSRSVQPEAYLPLPTGSMMCSFLPRS